MHIFLKIFLAIKRFLKDLLKHKITPSKPESFWVLASKRMVYPLLMLVITLLLGSLGYFVIGVKLGKNWDFLDCLFMTSITLTTVGYGDVFNAMDYKIYKLYTIIIMWVGMGIALYAISTITAFVVEEELGHFLKEKKMRKKISSLKNHYIVCGAGNMGIHIVNEMIVTKQQFVIIEKDEARIKKVLESHPDVLYLEADATDEMALKAARIEHAKGLIAALGSDSLNMLLTVTARFLNKDIRIVARCIEHSLVPKFKLSGADSVVSANFIGAMRIASEMLRPNVVQFLDKMLRSPDPSTRFEEITLEAKSELIGKKLANARIGERTGLTVVAVKRADSEHFYYNPKGDTELRPGDTLIVIGGVEQILKLKELAS